MPPTPPSGAPPHYILCLFKMNVMHPWYTKVYNIPSIILLYSACVFLWFCCFLLVQTLCWVCVAFLVKNFILTTPEFSRCQKTAVIL